MSLCGLLDACGELSRLANFDGKTLNVVTPADDVIGVVIESLEIGLTGLFRVDRTSVLRHQIMQGMDSLRSYGDVWFRTK